MTGHTSDDLKGSPDRFGYEWDVYTEILPEHEEQFRRCTAPLQPQDWQVRTFSMSAAAWAGTAIGRSNTVQREESRSISTSGRSRVRAVT